MNRKKCEFCGEPINRNDTFCKSCGNSIKNSKNVQDAIIDDPKGTKSININSKYIKIILIALAILLFIGLLL